LIQLEEKGNPKTVSIKRQISTIPSRGRGEMSHAFDHTPLGVDVMPGKKGRKEDHILSGED